MAETNSGSVPDERRDLAAAEERPQRVGIGEAEDQRGVEPLVGGVVVRDVRRVPELLDPGHEDLGSEFPQHPGACEGGHELVADELPEGTGPDAIPPAEVDQASRSRLLPGPATSYQRAEFGGPA